MSDSKFYQVYVAVCPSGGMSAASQERFANEAEAQALVDKLTQETQEVGCFISDAGDAFTRYEHEGMVFPAFWVQAATETNGIVTLLFE